MSTNEVLVGQYFSSLRRLVMIASVGLLAACGGGDVGVDQRRVPLEVATKAAPVYDRDDLYRFFVVAFGAAPGKTYMSQLVEAADYGLSIKEIVNIFTTKSQFLEIYPENLTHTEFAQKLVENVVGTSASPEARIEATRDISNALSLPSWTRGDITYIIFNNLAKKSINDPIWGNTSKKMTNQVAFAKYFTESMKISTTDLTLLKAVVRSVNYDSVVSNENIERQITADLLRKPNSSPTVVVDRYRKVNYNNELWLDGRSSYDVEGESLRFLWNLITKPTDSTLKISSPTDPAQALIPDIEGKYELVLTVSDGTQSSNPVTIVIEAVNSAPTAALKNSVVLADAGQIVELDGTKSEDPNLDILTYHWSLTSVPPESKAELESVVAGKTSFLADRAGTYHALLTVSDGKLSNQAEVSVLVYPADLTTPPKPINFTASGAYSTILLFWNVVPYNNHLYTEVWRSDTNDILTAKLLTTSTSTGYKDNVGTGVRQYYWIRYVSRSKIPGPFNSRDGTGASTAFGP